MPAPKTFGNWKVVLLSFLGATTFWFFSALGKQYNYKIQHPISFMYDTDSLVAVKPLPKYVELDVSGGGWDLFREFFWFGSDPILFELENAAAIRYLTRPTILPIISDQLDAYRINFLYTDTLRLSIDEKVSKKLPIQIDSLSLDMEEDHRVVSTITLVPDSVELFGPTSFLDTLDSYLLTIEERGIDESFDQSVEPRVPEGFGIRTDPVSVQVSFEVDQFDQLSIDTEVEPLNFPDDSSVYITDPNITVQFLIRRSLREEAYFEEDFNVIVDYFMLHEADSTIPPILVFYPEHAIELVTIPDSLALSYGK